jgi:hypothetical protein
MRLLPCVEHVMRSRDLFEGGLVAKERNEMFSSFICCHVYGIVPTRELISLMLNAGLVGFQECHLTYSLKIDRGRYLWVHRVR